MQIGKSIRERRLAAGLSQNALARSAGIDQSGLSKIERGENHNLTLRMLQGIASALGCSAADLLVACPDDPLLNSPRRISGRVLERPD